MSLLRPNPRALPFSITYRIRYRNGDGIDETEVTVVARNIVEGLAKALNTAHIHLEDVVKADIIKSEPAGGF